MKRSLLLTFVCLIVAAFVCLAASAQFPKIPKLSKPKPAPTPAAQTSPDGPAQPAQPQPESRTTTSAPRSSSAADDQPTVAKDTVQMMAFTYSVYKKNYDVWSWVPLMEYRVNGPISSGSQLYVEYTIPGGPPVKFDCRTEETPAGRWLHTTCGGRDGIPEEKATTYVGPFNFAIKMRNELAGSDSTLFTGKAKVAKAHSNEAQTPKFINHFVYYVDQDWNMPIGYVFYTEDSQKGMNWPILNLAFWVRGDAYNFQPHLFYQGKEVGKMFYEGEEVGKASCESEFDATTTQYVEDSIPQKAKWSRVICTFGNVRGWNRTGEAPGMFGPLYDLSANTGDYEFKLLWNNHLARSIKFTVGSGGKIDNGVATANKLGRDRVIVPVTIIGDQDGSWDKTAWRADAFYGNPLTGFSAP